MMSASKLRLIAVILAIIVAAGTVLGWELVSQQTLAERFIDRSRALDDF